MVLPKGKTGSACSFHADSARLAVVTRSPQPKGDALESDDERTEEHFFNKAPIVLMFSPSAVDLFQRCLGFSWLTAEGVFKVVALGEAITLKTAN